jgi:hypothetical protein
MGAARALAHGAFFQLSKWHERAREVLGCDGVEEVALVLGGVAGFVKLGFAGGVCDQSGVMPRREVATAETAHVLQGYTEFDLAVAEYVGVGSAAGALLAQEILEDPVAVLLGEANPV